MKYTILLTAVAVFAVAIFFVACSKSKNETPSDPSSEKFVDVNEENNGNTIHVLPGETIRIRVREMDHQVAVVCCAPRLIMKRFQT